MSRIDYDLLRGEMPGLELPHFDWLNDCHRALLDRLTRDELIARRTAIKLVCGGFNSFGTPIYDEGLCRPIDDTK